MRGSALLLLVSTAAFGADGLVLLPSPHWTSELEEDLTIALQVVPAALRPSKAHPLLVELHDEPAPYGMGSFDPHRLHLFGYQDVDDARANSRLGRLTAAQRQRLWRRRALVSALISRADTRLRWSSRAAWRSLAGWEGDRPLLVYPWAFSRRAGMSSPALDLVTFAEELLVPAESLDDDAVPLDDRVRCREPSKSRFLDERLAAMDPSWKPVRDCPRFDAWADVEHLPRFEVVFAAPSTSSTQAMFGHLLLRIVREDDASAGAVQVMQLAALISPLEPPASYFARGLAGGFRGVFSLTTLADLQLEALALEQRSLRRFSLELTVDQRRHLLERVWELERVGYIDYRFFKANCATMLRFLLAPVLGGPGPTLTPWETPTQVLDGLAPVLGTLETDEPSGQVARRAEALRDRLLTDAPAGVTALSPTLSPAGERERRMYRALANPIPGHEAWRAQVLLASLRIERYALDVANAARIHTERATVLPGWAGPSTDDLVAARQRRYEHETSSRVRAQAELAELLALDELLRTAPRRPFDDAERAVLQAEQQARETFDAVVLAVGSMPEDELARARAEERAAQDVVQAETMARGVPEGGHGHGSVGVGVLTSGVPVLRLRAAALAEQLGDQRLRGFGSRNAWRLLDASIELEPTGPLVHRADFTLLGVRALGDGGWGWGAGLDYAFLERAHEVALSGEALRVLAADQRLANFLVMTAGLRAGVRADPTASAVAYPRVGLAARVQLPGSFGNAFRFEGAYLPRLSVPLAFEHGAVAAAQLTLRLGVLGKVAFTARADLQAQWRQHTGFTGLAALGVELD